MTKKFFIGLSLFLILFFSISGLKIFCTQTVSLPDLLQPNRIRVGKSKIYITEGANIYIYSKNKFNLINKFGRKGEGPGEIATSRRGNASINIITGEKEVKLFNRNKLMTFTEDGKFLKEKRIMQGFVRNFSSVGNFYTGRVFTIGRGRGRRNGKQSVSLFDKNLKKVREIYSFESTFSRESFFKIFSPSNIFILRGGNKYIYLNKDKKFKILVFNINGKKVKEIEIPGYTKTISDKSKFSIKEYYKERFGQFWERIKNSFQISDTFPAIRDFQVKGSYIFVQTYIKKGDKNKLVILDKSGKITKTVYIPLAWKNAIETYPFDINHGKLYQLVEDEDEEEWSLNIYNLI